ncbi:MAG: glycine--tRNA ligase [Candidatus Micrarchaeia archaeon]
MQERIWEIALKRCFLIQAAEIYNPPGGFYDFGPAGAALKKKIENAWRDFFVKREGFLEVETTAFLPEPVLKASGHVAQFADPLVECTKCRKRFRADELIRDHIGKHREEYKKKKPEWASVRTEGVPVEELTRIIGEMGVACPECGGALAEAKPFNLMFKTNIGPVEGNTAYARPETAQGIFLDFHRVFRAHGSKLPLGIAQVGRSFRNEIAPRQGLLRLREFTQMELEYFFNPSEPGHPRFKEVENEVLRIYTREEQANDSQKVTEVTAGEAVKSGLVPNEIMAYFLVREAQFYDSMGVKGHRFRHMLPEETPHYSKGNFDLEVQTSYGWIETIGTAYRTDYDLSSHARASGKEISVFIEEGKKKIVPHVVEPSFGVDRLFWCVLEAAYRKGGGAEGRDWEWFDFPAAIAPFECAVLPLMKKDGLAEKAREVVGMLRAEGFNALYDESGSVGKRYARMDEVGVPYCITIDYETLKDESVTIRFRNDGKQERITWRELPGKLHACIKQNRLTA